MNYKRSKYKLYHADCLEQMRVLAEEDVKVDLVLTDPPYGVTNSGWDVVIPFKEMWNTVLPLCNKTTPIVLFSIEPVASHLRLSNSSMYKYDWIWYKSNPTNIGGAKYQPMRYHENICTFYKKWGQYYKQMIPRYSPKVMQIHKTGYNKGKGASKHLMNTNSDFNIDFSKYDPYYKNPSTILKYNSIKGNSHEYSGHPSQKPVPLLEYLIRTYTTEGDTVLDFTMGSGSTGVACMNTRRDFIGIELEEKYYKIAEKRISDANKQTKLF